MCPLNIRQRLNHQNAAPFARAIGLELLDTGDGWATTRLAARPATSISATDARIHPWALIGMADHALSYAFATVIAPDAGLSTLDLRLDFGAVPVGAVTATAHILRAPVHNGTATLVGRDETGAAVIAASALFNTRGFPGGGAGAARPHGQRYEPDHDGPFEALLGLEADDHGLRLTGGARRTVGFEGLPALHGGVIGALLAAACMAEAAVHPVAAGMQLATLHVRFLRPGGMAPLRAAATCARAGRSAAFFDAWCFHAAGENVASAQATLVVTGSKAGASCAARFRVTPLDPAGQGPDPLLK
jgi:acyl-coenzyme A thioesterase PaaI-like protein